MSLATCWSKWKRSSSSSSVPTWVRRKMARRRISRSLSIGRSLGGFQDLSDGGDEFLPFGFFSFELLQAGLGEFVKFSAAIIFGRAPAGFDPAATFEAMEGRVEGALLNLQHAAGTLMEAFGDSPAVFWAEGESTQDQETESALGEVEGLGGGTG